MSESGSQSLLSLSVEAFLAQAGARLPTPGGGAAAALTGSLAVAMGRMVVAYSRADSSDPGATLAWEQTTGQLERLDQVSRRLVDEDAAAYQQYSEVTRGIRKKQLACEALQPVARLAISVPLEVAATAVALLRLLDQGKGRTNPALRSDLAVAAHLADAACRSGAEMMRVNIIDLEHADDRARFHRQGDQLVTTSARLAAQIITFVHGE